MSAAFTGAARRLFNTGAFSLFSGSVLVFPFADRDVGADDLGGGGVDQRAITDAVATVKAHRDVGVDLLGGFVLRTALRRVVKIFTTLTTDSAGLLLAGGTILVTSLGNFSRTSVLIRKVLLTRFRLSGVFASGARATV